VIGNKGFVRKGKKTPYTTMKQNDSYLDAFKLLGSQATTLVMKFCKRLRRLFAIFMEARNGCRKNLNASYNYVAK
jgi:hypothetical protein